MFDNLQSKLINKETRRGEYQSQHGQSLVETAVIIPIVLLLLLGVFEVGWAVRGYLVLANVNREATRFAARGIYLDLDEKDDATKVGYEKVISHTLDSLSGQLSLDLFGVNPNGTLIATYYTVEPRSFNCLGDSSCAGFDCTRFGDPDRPDFVPGEDVNEVEYPLLIPPAGYENDPDLPDYYGQVVTIANTSAVTAYHYHQGAINFSRIDPTEKLVELRAQNNELNCQLAQKGLPPSSNSHVIIIENVYLQDQLVGLPFVTAFVPDPVPFYAHTSMRVNDQVRSANQPDDSVCELYPIMVPNSKIGNPTQGQEITIPIENSPNAPGHFSYVQWDSTANHSDGNLADNLTNPGNASTNFKEADDPSDTQINIGDWVESKPGTHASNEVKDSLNSLEAAGTFMRVPVWLDFDCPTPCSNVSDGGATAKFRIFTFVVMKLVEVDYQGNPKQLKFEFSHFDPTACPGDDRP